MTDASAPRLAGTFNFRVSLRPSAELAAGVAGSSLAPRQAPASDAQAQLTDGGFQEVSGLEVEMDVQELREGGRNDGVIRRVGRGKYVNLVLKRGMFFAEGGRVDPALWRWLQGILAGVRPVPRYDGTVQLLGADGETVLASWTFTRGLPAKVTGPQLNARTGEVAVEELHIAHEGLALAP
jgi:phage tail-like protein